MKEYKDILTVVRMGFSNGLYMDTEFLNGLQVDMDDDDNSLFPQSHSYNSHSQHTKENNK